MKRVTKALPLAATLLLAGCSSYYSDQYGLAPPDPSLKSRPIGYTPPKRGTPLNPADTEKAKAQIQEAAQAQAAQAEALQAAGARIDVRGAH
jgi:hypothetical protein